jgi:hypothetical protein
MLVQASVLCVGQLFEEDASYRWKGAAIVTCHEDWRVMRSKSARATLLAMSVRLGNC